MSKNKNEKDPDKQGLKEKAINIKEKESDGREISPQEKDRRDIHQPRNNA